MRSTVFKKPTDTTELTHALPRLRNRRLNSVSEEKLGALSAAIDLFELYRQLPSGMNPATQRYFKAKIKTQLTDTTTAHGLIREMSQHNQRYQWNRQATQCFNQDSFWNNAAAAYPEEKEFWDTVSPYAYYASDDLYVISAQLLPKLATYYEHAYKEQQKKRRWAYPNFHAEFNAFEEYLKSLKKTIQRERIRIAIAMVARLELAATYNDFQYDDVLFAVSERLQKKHINLNHHLPDRPYSQPRRKMTAEQFHYFHHYIMRYGKHVIQERCQALPWVKSGEYVYHPKYHQWTTRTALRVNNTMVKVPPSAGWLKSWFRGRYARYEAFHDISRILQSRAIANQATTRQAQLQDQPIKAYTQDVLTNVHRDWSIIQKEYHRIQPLKKGLFRVIHREARDAITHYSDELLTNAEPIVFTQLTALEKAQQALPTWLDQHELVDTWLQEVKQLEKAARLFPADYTVTVEGENGATQKHLRAWVEEKTQHFREKLADHCIHSFLLDLQNKTFPCHLVYNARQGRVVYRVANQKALDSYFENFVRYLSPQQRQAVRCLQHVMQGNYWDPSTGNTLSYDTLEKAARELTDDPHAILQPLFRRFIAPSILEAETSGYLLLKDYEQAMGDQAHQRSVLLDAVKAEEKVALYTALHTIFEKNPNLNENPLVQVGNRQIKLTDFCLRIRALDYQHIQPLVSAYLQKDKGAYDGQDEHLWPIFAVVKREETFAYAHQRLTYCLQTNDWKGLAQSRCLEEMSALFQETRSIQKTMMTFLQTVRLTDDNLEHIDDIVQRFADQARKTFWYHQREQYLSKRLMRIVGGQKAEITPQLQQYLTQHPNWIQSETTKQTLHRVFHDFRLNAWTAEQHQLLDTLQEPTLRQVYYTRLLKRILSNYTFATQHVAHLPKTSDWTAWFSLMNTTDFRTVCETAIERLHQQTIIDNMEAIRVLDTLLHGGLAVLLNLADLKSHYDEVLEKFKDQLHVENLSKEVIALIDEKESEKARSKIQWLRDVYNYYAAIGNQKEKDRAEKTLKKILSAVKSRHRLSISNPKSLLPHEALTLLQPMEKLTFSNDVLWVLKNTEQLNTIANTLREEGRSVREGKTNTLPSLIVYLKALRLDALNLTAIDRNTIQMALWLLKESPAFAGLLPATQQLVSALLRNLEGKATLQDATLLKTEHVPEEKDQEVEEPLIPLAPQETSFSHLKPAPLIPFTATTKEGQEIIDELQHDKEILFENSVALLKQIFTGSDQALKDKVSHDLFVYFGLVYQFSMDTKKEKPLRIQAGVRLRNLTRIVNKAHVDPNGDLALLTRNRDILPKLVLAFSRSLKAIVESKHRELPELGRLLMLCVQVGVVKPTLGQLWIEYLSNTLLLYVDKNPDSISNALSGALPSLIRFLKQEAMEQDGQRILAYETYYRDIVQSGMKQTDKVRIMPKPTISSEKEEDHSATADSERREVAINL